MFTPEMLIPFFVGVVVGVLGYLLVSWLWVHIVGFFKGSKSGSNTITPEEKEAPSGGNPHYYYGGGPPDPEEYDENKILKKKVLSTYA